MRYALIFLALWVAGSAYAASDEDEYNEFTIRPEDIPADAPKFEDFLVPVYTGPNAKPDLRGDRETRMFRTRLASWAKEKPNFAGHYILATWGCGTSCYSIKIIDAKTGSIYHPAGTGSNAFVNIHESLEDKTLQFRSDSKLLVLIGMPEEDTTRRGISYYVWENNKMKRIRFIHKAWYPEK